MIRVFTTRQKPSRGQVPKGNTFQNLVGHWLISDTISMLNKRHLRGKPPLDSGNAREVERLASFLMAVADQEFGDMYADDHPEGFPARLRLSRAKLQDGADERARWVLAHWDPSKIEGRHHGGSQGSNQGVRKGPTPRFTPADLRPDWQLPPRERRAAVLARTGMSATTFYAVARQMPAFLARLEQEELERKELSVELDPLLSRSC